MGFPPASTPPPPRPPPPPPSDASASPSTMNRTRKASRLRSLSTRPPGAERSVVHVDPATGKADGPHRKKLRTYLGIVARDKVDVTYENWKEVPTAQKDLIWEDLSKIAHGGQCLSISVHLIETCMRVGNSDIYGFLEPQSIQRSRQSQFESESYIKSWMQSSQHDVYLGAYLNGALKGLDDAPQPKSKASTRWIVVKCNRQKGSTECGYYVMHWMSTIILGTFRNNWEATIGAREIKGIADPVGTVLSPS
ncbi:hypothetical protein GmHk_12G034538 [Glycine max]|nr:hypothetical protein GmHk_12G034538 [Glycine max]